MKLDRGLMSLAFAAWVAAAVTGCGGVSASPSVSPASFFLPGLIQNAPTHPSPSDVTTNGAPATSLALAR